MWNCFKGHQSEKIRKRLQEGGLSSLQLGTITTDFITLHCITSAHIKAQSCSQDDGELLGGGFECMCSIWGVPGETDLQLTRYNPMTSKDEHIPAAMPNQDVKLPMPALSAQHLDWWNNSCRSRFIRYWINKLYRYFVLKVSQIFADCGSMENYSCGCAALFLHIFLVSAYF